MPVFASFVVLVAAAVTFGAFRLLRPRLALSPRPRLGGRAIAALLGEQAGPRPGQSYIPDTGQLTKAIIRGMVTLGYQTLTTPTRVLDPHIVVAGAPEDIEALRHFEGEVKTEIVTYVDRKGSKFRWLLNSPPTLMYCVDDEAVPGQLTISRAASPATVADPVVGPVTTRRNRYRPAAVEPAVESAAGAPTDGYEDLRGEAMGGGTRRMGSRPRPVVSPVDDRPSGTRYVSAGKTATCTGVVRLFRIGGGNVYHLKAGMNRVGRDADQCDIVCAYDSAISTVHLEVEVDGTEVKVRDAGSLNGTKINEVDLVGTQTLRHGDELRLGETKLRLAVGTASLGPTHFLTSEQ